jgi:hypothetical protein
MTDVRQRVADLLEQAERIDGRQTQIALLEEAIRLADLHADGDQGYRARKALIWRAYGVGRTDLMLIHFAWSLAHGDRHPEKLYRQEVLWSYRWVVDSLLEYIEITRSQIEDAITDMGRRYREAGCSPRPVHVLSRRAYQYLGDRAAAAAAGSAIDRYPRDRMADDVATELAFRVDYLVFAKQYQRAVTLAAPLLDGRIRSEYSESMVRCNLLLPLVKLARIDEARRLQKQGYTYASQNPRYASWIADQIEFLAVVGDLATAVRMAERHLPGVLALPAKGKRFMFFRSLRLLADRLGAAGRDRTTLKVPAEFEAGAASVRVRLDELTAYLNRELHSLATAFDARGGNDYRTRQLAELTSLNRLADRLARGVSP